MSKICVVLTGQTVADMVASLNACAEKVSLVELRIDTLSSVQADQLDAMIQLLKGRQIEVIWTVRRREENGHFEGDETQRLQVLQLGDRLGVDYVDVELRCALSEELQLQSARRILSYHDFEGCPEDMEGVIDEMERLGTDVAKVAFQVSTTADCARVMSLYQKKRSCDVVAIAMGEYGSCTRILGARHGMPWTYASLANGATAPGQFGLEELHALYAYEKISPQTRLFAVIGNPIAHSLSPQIHNEHYRREGLDACYVKIRVDEMDAFYRLAAVADLEGVSVTVPHKEDLMRWVSDSDYLNKVGAANTLVKEDDGWRIENTDIEAALTSVEIQLAMGAPAPRVLLLGAGGVARSLAHGMRERGWKVTVCNRSQDKAERLSQEVDGDWLHWNDRCAHGFDVVINGTILGMSPAEETTPLEFEGGHAGLVVFDTVYTPEETLLLKLAKAAGAHVVSGREMFHRQAALQHAHWFKVAPPWESMEEILSGLK